MAEPYLGGLLMDFHRWYAIFVVTGQEESIRTMIIEALSVHGGVEAQLFVPKARLKLPTDLARKLGKDEKVVTMFPGYVLVGTDNIEAVYNAAANLKSVLRFLKNDNDDFQQIRLEEISRLIYMADEKDTIGESEAFLDESKRIVVLSGPLKGEEGRIAKFNRRKGRVAVEFLIGTERREIWLSVKLIKES